MLPIMRHLLADDRAATAVEYTLIVCLIATVAIGGMTLVGQNILTLIGPASNALN